MIFFDALRVKIGVDAVVGNKTIYLALVLPDGTRARVNRQRRGSLDKEITFGQSR
jgi:transposase-like protein